MLRQPKAIIDIFVRILHSKSFQNKNQGGLNVLCHKSNMENVTVSVTTSRNDINPTFSLQKISMTRQLRNAIKGDEEGEVL